MRISSTFAAAGAAALAAAALAQDTSQEGMYVIFDASNSMWGELEAGGARKIEAAREVFSEFSAGDFGGRDVALRIYGRNRAGDCSDTELVASFASPDDNRELLQSQVAASTPRGKTPITRSLTAALEDFGDRDGDILLISDGIETCDADPCDLMESWREDGVDIRVYVVGFGLDDIARSAMQCVADRSGGRYFDADSAEELETALTDARTAAIEDEPIEPGEPAPEPEAQGYALVLVLTDAEGRRYRRGSGEATGPDGETFAVRVDGRNPVEAAGTYAVTVGPALADGTVFEPVTVDVEVTEPGETEVEVLVRRPPSVSARFVLNGVETSGSLVRAYQGDAEVFSFRSFDEPYAPPGTFEFRSQVNQDNDLAVTATLTPGEHTVVEFVLQETVHAYIEFVLPNGEIVRRNSRLYRDGEEIYRVHGRNGVELVAGTYELRSDDDSTPLEGVALEVLAEEDRTYQVPLDAGWIVVRYDPDAVYNSEPDRAFLTHAENSRLNSFARLGEPIPVQPGSWRVEGWAQAGDIADQVVNVGSGETLEVILAPR